MQTCGNATQTEWQSGYANSLIKAIANCVRHMNSHLLTPFGRVHASPHVDATVMPFRNFDPQALGAGVFPVSQRRQ